MESMNCSRRIKLCNWSTFAILVSCVWFLIARSAAAQSFGEGEHIFAQTCANCHGADGRGTDRGVAIATLPSIIAMSDADLRAVVHDGTSGGMPAFPQLDKMQAEAVVRYLRQLQGLTSNTPSTSKPIGDTSVGKAIFFGKGQCADCHMINGAGGFIAPDLTSYGRTRDAASILEAIVAPDKRLEPNSRVVHVITKSGRRITGVLRTEDNLQLVVQTQNGRYWFLNRNNLASVDSTNHSLMPNDYQTRLTGKELNDVVSFLIITGKSAPVEEAPARRHR